MEFVERGELSGAALDGYLREKLAPYLDAPIDAIVLGCTHYPFLTGAIRAVVGEGPEILDGSRGIAAQLRRRLDEAGLLCSREEAGHVTFLNSLDEPELLARAEALFRLP